MRADLHIHTYFSDGLQSPADVAAIAKANGVELVSVTDHDGALAYPELFSLCKERGIKAVSGIEVSAYYKDVRLHTLGYGMDTDNPDFRSFLKELAEGSLKRADDMLGKLGKVGVKLKLDDVLAHKKSPDAPVHAMCVARVGAAKGYSANPFAFYKKYLASGSAGYSGLCRPSPERAVEVLTACGAFTSLAHPGRIELEKEEVIALVRRLIGRGLKGIEAVYSTHTVTETEYYKEMANEYGLSVTGGSDTHFKEGSKHIGDPVFDCDEKLCAKLGI